AVLASRASHGPGAIRQDHVTRAMTGPARLTRLAKWLAPLLVEQPPLSHQLSPSGRPYVAPLVGLPPHAGRRENRPSPPDLLFHVKRFRGHARRGLERLHRRHAVIDEHLQLARAVAVCEDADVAAVHDRDAGVECGLEALALRLERLGLRAPGLPAAEVA